MADEQLVLSNVLCFTIAKLGKVASELLKTVLLDYYDVQDLVDAKKQLLSDIKGISTLTNVPVCIFQDDANWLVTIRGEQLDSVMTAGGHRPITIFESARVIPKTFFENNHGSSQDIRFREGGVFRVK